MPPLSELLNPEKRFNTFLFKGKPKTGKSIAAASFPRPIKYLDFDQRVQSIVEYFNANKIPFDDFDYESFMGKEYERFDKVIEEIRKFPGKYKTVVLDSLTNFAELALQYFVYLRGEHNSGSARKADDYKHKGVVDLLEVEDYGGEDRSIMNTLRILLSLKCHVVVIAHTVEVEYKDLLGNVTTSQTLLTGGRKIAAKIPSIFNEAYHFYQMTAAKPTEPNTFMCRTKATGIDWAGSVYQLPRELVFTGTSFFNVLQGELSKQGIELMK